MSSTKEAQTYSSQSVWVGAILKQQFDDEHMTLLSCLVQWSVAQLFAHTESIFSTVCHPYKLFSRIFSTVCHPHKLFFQLQ